MKVGFIMGALTLIRDYNVGFTSIPNDFFDIYMPKANGEFVKIYLYIVRSLSDNSRDFSLDNIADTFNHTESDVMRALRYWNNEGLLEFIYSADGKNLTGIKLTYPGKTSSNNKSKSTPDGSGSKSDKKEAVVETAPSVDNLVSEDIEDEKPAVPAKTKFTAAQIRKLAELDEIQEMNYAAERLLNRTLSSYDREVLIYLYSDLQFTVDLIICLIEYCVEHKKTSYRYIETLGIDWHSHNIKTIKEAKQYTVQFDNSFIAVLKAFGISGRTLGQAERDILDNWIVKYKFSDDMIKEACNRTVLKLGKPSFNYANSILMDWHEHNITTVEQLPAYDEVSKAAFVAKVTATTGQTSGVTSTPKKKKPSEFEQHQYDPQYFRNLIDNKPKQ